MEIKNLEELKELVEFCSTENKERGYPHYMAKVWFFIGQGRKIAAIKVLKDAGDLKLKDAKLKVESLLDASASFTVSGSDGTPECFASSPDIVERNVNDCHLCPYALQCLFTGV